MTDPATSIATALVANFEGFRSEPYQDSGGIWTIGYGFTVEPDGRHVTTATVPITQEAAYARLADMVARLVGLVRGMVHVPVTDHQVAALVSLAFNIGANALRNSTLLKFLNQGNVGEAGHAFMAWVYAAGVPNDGLRRRRAAERVVFLTADEPCKTAPNYSDPIPETLPAPESEADRLDDEFNGTPES